MSSESSRCRKHPAQRVVGVCASCLREKLVVVAQLQARGGFGDSASSSSQHSPARNEASASGVPGRGTSRSRKTLQHGVESRRNSNASGNASGLIQRSKSFSDEKDSVATITEDGFSSGTMTEIGQVRSIKKPLWTLFNLDDVEHPQGNVILEQDANSVEKVHGSKNDGQILNTSAVSSKNATESKNVVKSKEPWKHEHLANRARAFSMHVEPEAGRNSSWLSSIFRRRQKKSRPKYQANMDNSTEWEDARSSFQAGRPSLWEQCKLSSLERSRRSRGSAGASSWQAARPSSWEAARPSWEAARPISREAGASYEGLFSTASMTAPASFHYMQEWGWKGRQDTKGGSDRYECSDGADFEARGKEQGVEERMVVVMRKGGGGGGGGEGAKKKMQRDASTQTTPLHRAEKGMAMAKLAFEQAPARAEAEGEQQMAMAKLELELELPQAIARAQSSVSLSQAQAQMSHSQSQVQSKSKEAQARARSRAQSQSQYQFQSQAESHAPAQVQARKWSTKWISTKAITSSFFSLKQKLTRAETASQNDPHPDAQVPHPFYDYHSPFKSSLSHHSSLSDHPLNHRKSAGLPYSSSSSSSLLENGGLFKFYLTPLRSGSRRGRPTL